MLGKNLSELTTQMTQKGPNNRWAQTPWKIDWDDNSNVKVVSTITMPKPISVAKLDELSKIKLKSMLIALRSHELQHAQIGLYAAENIGRENCQDTENISNYWKRKNRHLDMRTKFGKLEGVSLQ
ncbi:MAG: DUF922 domain-containing protein [Pseudoruegeria sp.]